MDYIGRYLELHPSQNAIDVHDHILHHLPHRIGLGNAVIICEQPERFLPSLAKRWKKITLTVERLHAATFDRQVKRAIQQKLEVIRKTRFVLRAEQATVPARVLVQSPEVGRLPPHCATLYIATSITAQQLQDYARQLPPKQAILLYASSLPPEAGTLPTREPLA